MTDQTQKITVECISSSEHTEIHFTPEEAIEFLITQYKNNYKWVFIDGEYVNPDEISLEDIIKAKDIIITNSLMGG